MKYFATLAASTALGAMLASGAVAQDAVTLDILYPQPGFAKFHEPIAEEYTRLNPHVTIHFRAPAKDYDEGHLLMQRLAVTNQLPDVYYTGYHLSEELIRVLSQRDQVLDLGPLLDAEPQEWVDANYSEALLNLGRVDGVQYGMAFNASLPITYVNEDLLSAAGFDPKDIPDEWDGILEIAQAIHAADSNVSGVGYAVHEWPDDWLWQAILRQAGSALVDPETGKAGFDNEGGLEALKRLRSFAVEGSMPLLEFEQSRQLFIAGQTAFFFDTPARLSQTIDLVGDRFTLGTAIFPVDDKENGGLPTGGSSVIVTASDEATQAAAWDFIKFATGPEAQKIVVETTGYLPANLQAPEHLKAFYDEDPRFAVVAELMDLASAWEGYQGGASVRIWRAQREIISSVMRGDISPEDGLARLVSTTNDMLD